MTDMHQSTNASDDLIKNRILSEGVQKHIILTAYLNGEPLMGTRKLQHIIFLLSDVVRELKDECRYDAGTYGPHSEIVAYKLDDLIETGVLCCAHNKIETTLMGEDIAKELLTREPRRIIDLLSEYKTFLNDLTADESFAYVYSAYPSMVSASIKIDELKSNMENHIMSLVQKQKISAQRAAELLQISYRLALKKAGERGIRIFE